MASVRMSNDLRSMIRRNAMQAFDVSNPEPQLATADINYLVESVATSESQRTLSNIFDAYCNIPKYISGYSYDVEKHAFGYRPPSHSRVTRLDFILENKKSRISIEIGRSVIMFSTSEYADVPITVITDPAKRLKAEEIITNFKKRQEDQYDSRQTYSNTISQLLDKCTTLKQFLTAWPAGESFVPGEKVSELHTKVTRIQKARQIKEDISFDDTAVNKVVLTAKLMGN